MHADRLNRLLLTILGLLALAIGTLGLVAGFGGFGQRLAHRRLFDNTASHYIGRNGDWLWILAALAALIILILALRWLYLLLFSTDRAESVTVPSPNTKQQTGGQTHLIPAALSDAVAAEINTYRGVSAARARVLNDPRDPHLVVTVAIERGADIAALRNRIDHEALAHARTALDRPELPVQLDITIAKATTSRAR